MTAPHVSSTRNPVIILLTPLTKSLASIDASLRVSETIDARNELINRTSKCPIEWLRYMLLY